MLRYHSSVDDQEGRGSTHWGDSRPPKPPPGGDHANETLTHPADVLPSKIKSFYTDELRQNMDIFPADVLPRKHVHNSSDRRRHLKYL